MLLTLDLGKQTLVVPPPFVAFAGEDFLQLPLAPGVVPDTLS
jgi:hypothetical protein